MNSLQINLIKPNIEECTKIFNYIDKDESGYIDIDELTEALKMINIDIDLETVQILINLVDYNFNGVLELKEFIKLIYILENAHPSDIKTVLFLAADKDYSGSINKNELKDICTKLQLELSDQEIESTYKAIIENQQENEISYKQFIKFIGLILQQ